MKASDRAVLVGILILGIAASFWFFLLSPKRDEASKLGDQVAEAEAAVAAQQATLDAGVAARDNYEESYRSLVVLGKAAPESSDTAALITQVQGIANKAKVGFDGLSLDEESVGAVPPAAQTTTDQAQQDGSAIPEANSTTTAAAPTEASAAALPLGATVGAAGLPVMPYELTLSGNFFELADYFASIDRLVAREKGRLVVDGRLITVDGFVMAPPDDPSGVSKGASLDVTLNLTTYLVPASQGISAGATSTTPPESVPAASSPPATAPTPTATVTP